jgi:hypothetical protein
MWMAELMLDVGSGGAGGEGWRAHRHLRRIEHPCPSKILQIPCGKSNAHGIQRRQ